MTCRSCHRPILFAWTTKGKKLPLDPEPSPAGNVLLAGTTAHVLSAADAATLRAVDQALWTSLSRRRCLEEPMTHDHDPSYQDLLDIIDDQKSDIARLTRERDEWEANEQESHRDVVRLEARVEVLEGELRRLRDLVGVEDVAIIDWVLHG